MGRREYNERWKLDNLKMGKGSVQLLEYELHKD
jgi:hypothetical protein